MPRRPNEFPSYRRHKSTNQVVCTVRLANGKRKDMYLGRWKSAASKAEAGHRCRLTRRCLFAHSIGWSHGGISRTNAEPDVAPRPGPNTGFARHHVVAAAPAGELQRSATGGARWG